MPGPMLGAKDRGVELSSCVTYPTIYKMYLLPTFSKNNDQHKVDNSINHLFSLSQIRYYSIF